MAGWFHSYEEILRQVAIRPIQQIEFKTGTMRVVLQEDQEYIEKFDLPLRLFISSLRGVKCSRKEATQDCCSIPLGYFKLLGWHTGDAALFEYKGIKLAIEFS